ncbi:MAG: hypothetical protein V1720_01655 [bacterium]
MKTLKYNTLKIIFLSTLIMVLSCSLSYSQISVVVSKSSTQTLTKDAAKEVFSGARTTWSTGAKILVVDQSETEIGKKFYDVFLGKSASQVRVQWTKLVLSGQATAPVKASSDDDVKSNVAKNPNAVGYISTKSLDGSVKELFKIE